jgi:hypothetical protein
MGLGASPQYVQLVHPTPVHSAVLLLCLAPQPRGILATPVATLTSIAWFPAPETPSPDALRYLDLERRWLSSGPLTLVMGLLVATSLWLLGAAFWQRHGSTASLCSISRPSPRWLSASS